MNDKRTAIPDSIRAAVISAQRGRCALCGVTHPVDFHHIVPRHSGGLNDADNLVLLCRNHHHLADSGVLSPEMLRYYKRLVPSGVVVLPADHTVIYEWTADHIVGDLLSRYDPALMRLAQGLLSRLQRVAEPRYRHLCLELIFGIVYASMHEEAPNVRRLERMERRARNMANELGSEGDHYRQLIAHYLGVVYHNVGKYRAAKAAFEHAVAISDEIVPRTPDLDADKGLASVSMTATEHLSGLSERSLDHLRSVISELPRQSGPFANTHCFAQIKLAEHMLVRGAFDRAQQILEDADRFGSMTAEVLPIYRVILVKDLARTHVLQGNRDRGVRLFVRAMALAEAFGFRDQQRKIKEVATMLGIDVSELESA
ncbi:HNH endonuclease [Candidatus Bipolaricaulota bacterium]|nr:HNH endonuclease [Candidatus Bipolaricaulota bacterium]